MIMQEYYFKTIGDEINSECTEPCMVKNNGIMIGSVACQECDFCVKTDRDKYGNVSWIVCTKINEATKKQANAEN